jgi:branched-chain amino acid transport system permease protein
MRRDSVYFCIAGGVFAVALAICATTHEGYVVQVVAWAAINVILALALRFMLLVGEVNLGVGGFFGIAAYATAVLTVNFHMPTVVVILLATVFAGAASLPFGFVTLRVSGHYFMLISFALTEILRLTYSQTSYLGSNSGFVGIVPDLPMFPVIVVSIAAATFVGLLWLERSHFGRIMRAVSDNPLMVQAVGISVSNVKLVCLLVSALGAGLAGSCFAFTNTVIAPGDFGFLLPVYALAYVKIGGQAHPVGAVLGTVVMSLLAQLVIGWGAQDTLLFGASIVVTMLFMPAGIVGLIDRLFSVRTVAERIGKPVAVAAEETAR